MMNDLFSRYFFWTLLIIATVEVVSFFALGNNIVNTLFFVLLTIFLLLLASKKPEYLILTALTELIIGSKGRLFQINIFDFSLSIRILIFILTVITFLFFIIKNKSFNQITELKKYLKWTPIALMLVIIWGILQGIFQGNNFLLIYSDANAWLFFAYLIVFPYFLSGKEKINHTIQVFLASVTAVCLKSLFLLFAFSHQFSGLRTLYRWARDTRFGEITLLSGNFYRIFSQAHIFVLIGLIILICFLIFQKTWGQKNKNFWYLISLTTICLSTTIISLSRSNWVGLFFGLVFILITAFAYYHLSWKQLLKYFGLSLSVLTVAVGLILIIVYFPFPKAAPLDPGELFKERIAFDEPAAASRWNQVPNLIRGIIKHPIIGSGWGTTITYHTEDLRILEQNSNGLYKTYAFEWGYLDILLKIGLTGLFIYLMFIYYLWKKGWQTVKSLPPDKKAWLIGMLGGLITLLFTNIFSPYLNHPLGIGYLILLTITIINYNKINENNYASNSTNQS